MRSKFCIYKIYICIQSLHYITYLFSDMKKDTLSDRRSEGRSSDSGHHHKHKRKFHSHQAFTPKVLNALLYICTG